MLLRLAGVRPATPAAAIVQEPVVQTSDDVLGWRTKPGHYRMPPYAPEGDATELTILPGGSRATAPRPSSARDEILFVGCSFTFGWAISDAETLAWRVQALHSEARVVNRGVNAYGTYQVLLLLEELFAAGERPARVIYGFHEVHEERNVASPRWLELLDRNARRGHVMVPYATLDASGALVRHAPERAPEWPLRGELATVALLERLHADWAGRDRVAQARAVTERVLIEIRDLCKRHGVPFEVVLLQAPPAVRKQYGRFLARSEIPFADCVVPIPPEKRVPGEGHPNGEINASWAECVESKLLRAGT